MADVIRQDVVQISFEVDNSLQKLNDDMTKLKKVLGGSLGDETFSDMEKDAKKSTTAIEKLKNGLKKVGDNLTTIGKKAAGAAFTGLKKLAGISFKALIGGVTGAAAAIGGLVAKSVQAYGQYEQLFGGVETLLGAKGAKTAKEFGKLTGTTGEKAQEGFNKAMESQNLVMKNANNAFKTAGMSANTYMETITTFAASLKTSVGNDTMKAAKLADVAIQDMADNANKMGTPLESVSTVYSNLARGMYMTLDNLKLGYAGTKEGAMDMVNHAAKIDKSVKANDLSYANLVKAIHAVQVEMDITGTTSKEAFGTIQGSMGMFKAAWGNLMPALIQGGDAFDQCVNNLVDSLVGFKDEATGKIKGGLINNLLPAIEKALAGVGTLIDRLAPIIAQHFPVLAEKIIPPLVTAAWEVTKGLFKALPTIIKTLFQTIADMCGKHLPALKSFFGFFADNSGSIAKFVPVLLGLVGAFMAFKKVNSVISVVSGIFGKGKGGKGGEKGGSGLFGGLEKFAKTKPTLILKGMANLAIIMGGFTILAAAMAAVAPYIAKLSDAKSMIELVGYIAALGIVGTALAKMGEICGKIPVSTVALGLANMAIMLAGVSALYLLVGAVSLIKFDLNRVMKITLMLGVLGTIGAALSVFAGIAGLIPIPVVLLGLANMALVLGGMSALIVAFGKLTEVQGFVEFIEKGGEILPKICNIIGEMAGSLVGGLAEGVTNSLPKIGENIAAFATSLKPMFTMFSGADMSGIGSFFKSLGSFMLQMAGEGILSFFTGGTDFGKLGESLNTFAESSQGFFTKVAEFPENGFTNATKLFDCLAGMKSLPKEGGVVGWFTGNINYEALANGLQQLSSTKVIDFFYAVSELQQAGFDNATKLFDCLAGMKSLPKEGGVAGWFTGNINYENLATGLGHLASEGAKNFFTMVGGLPEKTFENITALFNALASIKELPKEGGWWDKVTGTETSTLSSVASELGGFGDKTKAFFEQVNNLNLTNLNGLWKSLNGTADLTVNISSVVDEHTKDIVKKITDLPSKMAEGLKSNKQVLADAFVEVWKNAVEASVKPVNKLISGANWILKEFGSKKVVADWTPYANGTNGHKGGNALVNDGRGAELIQMPNGNMFIPRGRNVFLPNAPKGMKVLSAENTASLLGRTSPTFRYANGNIDLWSFYDNASGLIDAVKNKYVNYKGTSALSRNIGEGAVNTISGEMVSWAKKLFEESGQSIASYVASKGVSQWLPTVVRALKMEGLYNASNVARTLFQMRTESGGNPLAINNWDSNAKKGTPSKGLMQVIDPTFKAYARKGFDKNIYDPLSNILASLRYATSRYGTLSKAYRGVGYSKGVGNVSIPNQPNSVEVDYTPESSYRGSTEYNTYAPVFNFHINGGGDTRATARAVKQAAKEALREMIEGMERKRPMLQEY